MELELHHEERNDFGRAGSYRYITVDSGASQSNVKTGIIGFLRNGWGTYESPSGYAVACAPYADSESVVMVPPNPDLIKEAERTLARCVRSL